MVTERTFRKRLGRLEGRLEGRPSYLWEDELKKGMDELFSSEDMISTLPGHSRLGLSPFSDILGYASRIEAVNEYFRVKAGQVLGSEKALDVLVQLRSKRVIPKDEWRHFDINKNAVLLAMLSAAGFCEVNEHSISITDQGKQFLDDILE